MQPHKEPDVPETVNTVLDDLGEAVRDGVVAIEEVLSKKIGEVAGDPPPEEKPFTEEELDPNELQELSKILEDRDPEAPTSKK